MRSKIQYVMRWPEGKPKALTLSYDDGVDTDIKLIEIMKKYGIKGTFNINSGLYSPEGSVREPDQIHFRLPKSVVEKAYDKSVCEIACHTQEHGFLEKLPKEVALDEVLQDRKNLEKLFNCQVRGLAYPYGTYNNEVIELLKLCGIAYARTVKSTFSFNIPENWLELNPTCHHKAEELNELTEKFIYTEQKDIVTPYLFYLWGHSYEFRADNNWDLIENFCNKVSNKADVWYATNIEVYNYVTAFNQLQFDANFTRVYNPTATDVWILINENSKSLKIPAGKEIIF